MRFETRAIGVFEVLSVQLVANEVFDAGRLRQETLRLVERGSRRIIIDLGGVDYLYSDSINALVALNRRMLEASGRMGILVPHPKVYDILVRAGLENIMRLYRSEAELQSDSRELMRQSSAWTRPAELLSAANASQILSQPNLKSPGDLREAASASQRIPRRRVGSRVEVKSRRRGGRGLDQENTGPDIQLPPALPGSPSESTTLRVLSQDSSTFDQIPPPPRPGRSLPPPTPPQPRPAAEATVYHVPENTQHDGYSSTDAWLLSLTSQQDPPGPTASQMVAQEIAADSSSFLPKVAPEQQHKGIPDAPSQFPESFSWDESEIPLTDSPPPAPQGYAQPPNQAPSAPTTSSAWLAPQQIPQPPPSQGSPSKASTFLDDRHSTHLRDTPSTHSSSGQNSAYTDPWQPPPFQPLPPEQDVRSAIFYDHGGQVAAPPPSHPGPSETPWSDPTIVLPTQRLPQPGSGAHPAPAAPSGSRSDAAATDSWFGGPSSHPASVPPPTSRTAPPSPGASSGSHTRLSLPVQPKPTLDSWFDGGSGAAAPPRQAPSAPPSSPRRDQPSAHDSWIGQQPTAQPPRAPAPRSAQDSWISQAPAPSPKPAAHRDQPSAHDSRFAPPPPAPPPQRAPSPQSAQDSWISQAPVQPSRPAAHRDQPSAHDSRFAPPPPAPPPQRAPSPQSAQDSWISQAPTSPSGPKPSAAPRSAPTSRQNPSPQDSWISQAPGAERPAPRQAPSRPSAPSPTDSWITSTPAEPTASQSRTLPASRPQPGPSIGGTAWIEPTKAAPKRRSSAKEPSNFDSDLDIEEPSGKKPLWIALAILAAVAAIGLGIFFLGGSGKNGAEVPPTTAEETALAEPAEAPQQSEPAATEPEPAPAVEEPAPAKTAPKPKPKAESKPEPKKSAAKETTKKEPAKPVAPPPPPPEEDHAPVKIFATSRPSGATLYLDGAKLGTTPREVTIKRKGVLEFSLAGYRKQSKSVDPEETRGTVNVQLSPDGGGASTGKIYLTSAPTNAEIVVGGKVVGKTPKMVELPVGSQKVTVRSGVLSKSRTLDIQSGTNTAENFSL